MIQKTLISFLALIMYANVFAQHDTLLELGGNNTIGAFYNANKDLPNSVYNRTISQNKKVALTLPFIDDFSQNNIFPDANLWEDINVYINSNFPDNPITFGVATFDGLDATGTPYNFANPTSYGPADTLTSKQIDLTTVDDSVYFSFYYQPQGVGNKPETKDSIRLEFLDTSNTWVRMWGMPGMPNQPFQRVMVPVDSSFQSNAFQFRFMNWATLSGNVDHWHIDYVFLNDSLTYLDTALNDVSFITNHHNLLKELTALPWQHYLTALVDTASIMDTAMHVTYRNNHSSQYAVFYNYEVIDSNGAGPVIEIYPTTTSSRNVPPYSNYTEPQAVYKNFTLANDFYYPVDLAAQTKVFQIKNYFKVSPQDDYLNNDTVFSYQVFSDYYAYDDGSAEVGYGVQGIGSKLAHEFDIKKDDTLTAIQIYFNPIMNDLSSQTFRLKVWSSLTPEIVIYSQPTTQFTSPVYSNTNEYLNYVLNVPLYLTTGTYYFGWEKITSEFLNVGWDVNTNNRNKVHFNSVGVWQNPSLSIPDGSLMLRPVFGNLPPVVVNVNENETKVDDFEVYPNPTSETIYFKNNNTNHNSYHISLVDIYGKIVIETESALSNKIDVSNIASGIYIVRFTNNDTQNSILKKIIISK